MTLSLKTRLFYWLSCFLSLFGFVGTGECRICGSRIVHTNIHNHMNYHYRRGDKL